MLGTMRHAELLFWYPGHLPSAGEKPAAPSQSHHCVLAGAQHRSAATAACVQDYRSLFQQERALSGGTTFQLPAEQGRRLFSGR